MLAVGYGCLHREDGQINLQEKLVVDDGLRRPHGSRVASTSRPDGRNYEDTILSGECVDIDDVLQESRRGVLARRVGFRCHDAGDRSGEQCFVDGISGATWRSV